MTPVRAVLFDVDGTLYHQAPLRACMSAEIAASVVTAGSLANARKLVRVLSAYRGAHETVRSIAAASRSIADLQLEEAARRADVGVDEMRATVAEWMQRRPLKYLRPCRRRDLVPLLTDLTRRGLALGVLSDYPCDDKLAALGVRRFFSLILCTSDQGVNALKPHPRGFLRACELWNLQPSEVLYVGDRPEVDGTGARAAGTRCAIVGGRYRGRGSRPAHAVVSRLREISALVG